MVEKEYQAYQEDKLALSVSPLLKGKVHAEKLTPMFFGSFEAQIHQRFKNKIQYFCISKY